jgi:hypothetical protein
MTECGVPGCASHPEPLLTAAERNLIRALGLAYRQFEELAGHSPLTRDDDLAEVRLHVHALQRMIMAQAAARAFPGELRALGLTVTDGALANREGSDPGHEDRAVRGREVQEDGRQ